MIQLILLISSLLFSVCQIFSAEKPNVIVILVDDQGYYDLSCYGATEVETQNIDKLAQEGIRFTDYYAAAPICSPSRAGLLTGCYPKRVGMATWVQRADSQIGLHENERTLAELFHANGYQTACIGKWHLGDHESFRPLQQGFDHYYGLMHNLDPVETLYYEKEGGVPIIRNGEVVKRPADPAELTRLYTDEAIDFIKKKKDHPFFIYLPHTMLHVPLGVSPEFKGSSKWGEYGDAIQEMDHHVGRLMNCLEQEDLDKKTIVVYVPDNGRGPGRNAQQPIQGRKLSTYEGGIRVPCIAWGPGVGIQSQESNAITSAMDLFPTLATFANIKVPRDRVIDGRDLSPLWKAEIAEVTELSSVTTLNSDLKNLRPWSPPQEWDTYITRDEYQNAFFYHGSHGSLAAVRSGDYKLYLNPTLRLFNLAKDPGETKPIRDKRIRAMRGMSVLFQNEMREYARPAGKNSVKETPLQQKTKLLESNLKTIESYTDLTYASYGDVSLKLDLYKPKIVDKKLPAIICIHGGGWFKGNKSGMTQLAQKFATKDFVAVSIAYRLSDASKFPANIQDCKAAVRWLRAHADQYDIDKTKIAAIGSSAGGHLAALLASSGGIEAFEGEGGNPEYSSLIQAAISIGTQTDFSTERIKEKSEKNEEPAFYNRLLGGSYSTQPDLYKLASPITHVDRHDPPILFMSGEQDHESTQAIKFRHKLGGLGVPTNYRLIRGAPHGFLKRQVWFDDAFRSALNFLHVHFEMAE